MQKKNKNDVLHCVSATFQRIMKMRYANLIFKHSDFFHMTSNIVQQTVGVKKPQ